MGLVWFEAHPRVTTSVQEERGLLSRGVDMVVVRELGKGDKGVPVILAFIHKQLDILFQFLVDPFCLAVGLWVVSCG